MNQARLPRSYLLVPGNRPERFDKALASGADAVIIDLEDAVPPDQKESARATVSGRLTSSKPVVLRINAVETPWFADDLAICRNAGVAAVMLAKTQRAGDLHAVGAGIALVPLIESAAGFDQLAATVRAPRSTSRTRSRRRRTTCPTLRIWRQAVHSSLASQTCQSPLLPG